MLSYLGRLQKRMEQRRFPSDDRLYVLVSEAFDRLHTIRMELHYLSCGDGVRR